MPLRVAGAAQVQTAKKFASCGDVPVIATDALTTDAWLPTYPTCNVCLSRVVYYERCTCAVCGPTQQVVERLRVAHSGSATSIKRGYADEVPRCKTIDKSECIHIDELIPFPAAAAGHNGLATVRSAGSTGKLGLEWAGGGFLSRCVYIACNASCSCCSSFTCSVRYDSLNLGALGCLPSTST